MLSTFYDSISDSTYRIHVERSTHRSISEIYGSSLPIAMKMPWRDLTACKLRNWGLAPIFHGTISELIKLSVIKTLTKALLNHDAFEYMKICKNLALYIEIFSIALNRL